MRILVMNGPNLNMTGIREKHLYGSQSLDEVNVRIREAGEQRGHAMTFYQSNHEGDIIDQFHKMYFENNVDGVIYNPGAHVHYSYAIKDAIIASQRPVIEVHFANLYKRVVTDGEYRKISVTAPACVGYIAGLGAIGYILAIQGLEDIIKNK